MKTSEFLKERLLISSDNMVYTGFDELVSVVEMLIVIKLKEKDKKSLEFAISVLEEIHFNTGYVFFIDDKIQELKTYLDEKC